jgi:surfactin synthase thioesterase subunit
VTAFSGRRDPEVTPAEMSEWAIVTSGPFQACEFDGDHFFPIEHKADVVAALVQQACTGDRR